MSHPLRRLSEMLATFLDPTTTGGEQDLHVQVCLRARLEVFLERL